MNIKRHWDKVYANKGVNQLSWRQKIPMTSLRLIENADLDEDAAIIDVGGGASTLVDHLLTAGYNDLTVLDISGFGLEVARLRLAGRAREIHWEEGDITQLPVSRTFNLWHDRAVFHFMTTPEQRAAYRDALMRVLRPRGQAIIAAFAPDGPTRCSGLPTVRYSPEELLAELGAPFKLLESVKETHLTPSRKKQSFIYCRLQKQ